MKVFVLVLIPTGIIRKLVKALINALMSED